MLMYQLYVYIGQVTIVFRSENIKTQWSVSLADSRTTGSGKLIVIILAAKAKSK